MADEHSAKCDGGRTTEWRRHFEDISKYEYFVIPLTYTQK